MFLPSFLKKHLPVFILTLTFSGILQFLSCLQPVNDSAQDPKNARIFVNLKYQDKSSSEFMQVNLNDSIKVGTKFLLSAHYDSADISIYESVTSKKTDSLLIPKDSIKFDTLWSKFVMKKTGQFKIIATGFIKENLKTHDTATIIVENHLPIIKDQSQSGSVLLGNEMKLFVSALSTEKLTYQWYKNGALLSVNDSIYKIQNSSFADSGKYWCKISNGYGFVMSDTMKMQVYSNASNQLVITQQPTGKIGILNSKIEFKVKTTGENLTYQWYHNFTKIQSAISDSLILNNIQYSDTGSYYVVISNGSKNLSSDTVKLNISSTSIKIHFDISAKGKVLPAILNNYIEVAEGSSQTFQFIPDTGYSIAKVYVDSILDTIAIKNGEISINNIQKPHFVKIEFSINKYILNIKALNGTVDVMPIKDIYEYGTQISLTAQPKNGYYFTGWTGDKIDTSKQLNFKITRDMNISANFAEIGRYVINTTNKNGKILRNPDSTSYLLGSLVTLTAMPDTGYRFVNWTGDTTSQSSQMKITVDRNRNVEAKFEKIKYTVTTISSIGGAIDPQGPISVEHGQAIVFKFIPQAYHHIKDVIVNNTSKGIRDSLVISNVIGNTEVKVLFAPDTFEISASAGNGGAITPSGKIKVLAGFSRGFRISPLEGMNIIDVVVDSISKGAIDTFTFTSVTKNHSIQAVFSGKSYIITASADVNGKISPSGSVGVPHDSSKTFTITPNFGYEINSILVDGISKGNGSSYTFTKVNEPHIISATFKPKTFIIKASSGVGGTISPSGDIPVLFGAEKQFTFSPDTGYELEDVIVDGVSKGPQASYSFPSISSGHTITAKFSLKKVAITTSAGTGGTISPSGVTSVEYNASKTFTITPNTGYVISEIKVDGVSKGSVSSITLTNIKTPHTIEAIFGLQSYKITAIAGTGGAITPAGDVSVLYGQNKGFRITPNTGMNILDLVVDGVSQVVKDTFTFVSISGNHTISATFSANVFTITAGADANGKIEPSGSVGVAYNTSKTFTITPNTGYEINSVVVDGTNKGAVSTYTFDNVTTGHTINVTFKPKVYSINASAETGGTISPTGVSNVNHGSSKLYTVSPSTGYDIFDILVDNVSVGKGPTYNFTNITGPHTIVAKFTIQKFTITATAATSGGTITPNGAVQVDYNANSSFTISPNSNYVTSEILVDGVAIDPTTTSYTFQNVTTNHSISAKFAAVSSGYTVNASAGTGGTISPSGSVAVSQGAKKIFVITPDAGYEVLALKIDGQKTKPASKCTLTVNSNMSIQAIFEPKTFLKWNFDSVSSNKFYDVSGSNYHLSDSGNSNLNTKPGILGNAVHLTNDNFNLVAYDTKSLINFQSFTISAWFKSDSSLINTPAWDSYRQIFHYGAQGNGMALTIDWAAQSQLFMRTSGASDLWLENPTIIQPNVWYHLVFTYDNGAIKMYLNGALEIEGFQANYTPPSDYNIHIGCQDNASFKCRFKGYLDEIKVYQKCLNLSEIQNDYNTLK